MMRRATRRPVLSKKELDLLALLRIYFQRRLDRLLGFCAFKACLQDIMYGMEKYRSAASQTVYLGNVNNYYHLSVTKK